MAFKRTIFTILTIFLTCTFAFAQNNSGWRSYLSYKYTSQVADAESRVFGVSEGALYSISKKDPKDVRYYDRSSGLSEVGISKIAYDRSTKKLVIYYEGGNIDFFSSDGIENLSAIKDNIRLKSKEIRRILFSKDKMYLAGGFGVSVVDLKSLLVLATYFQGQAVSDMVLSPKGTLWVLKENKLYEGDEKNNLQDPYYWNTLPINIESGKSAQYLAVSGGMPAVAFKEGSLVRYSLDGGDPVVISKSGKYRNVKDIAVLPNGYAALAENYVVLMYPDKEETETINAEWPLSVSANGDPNILWGAYSTGGIGKINLTDPSKKVERFPLDDKDFPADNVFFRMTSLHGRLYAVSGGFDTNRLGKQFQVKIFDGKTWMNIGKDQVDGLRDASFITVDPKNPGHFFVSTHGEGLIEFKDFKFDKVYDESNSPLETAAGIGKGYCRVGPTFFDPSGNLWLTELGVPGTAVLVLAPNGEIKKMSFANIAIDNSFTSMLRMPNGTAWLAINHENPGLYAFEATSQSLAGGGGPSVYISSFIDRSGRSIPQKRYYAMALDKNNSLWLGSENGLAVVAGAASALKQIPLASRPVAGEEPNLYYVLDNIVITGIQVDRLNNKWVATMGEGLYLLNGDCTQLLRHYTVENSPILSNNVTQIALDEVNGLLFIATDRGLMSLQTGSEEATKEALKSVYAYPNPLRPEDPDGMTIAGLKIGCDVRIIDPSGQLVFKTVSVDDHVVWPARYSNGERVASGVYQVLVYSQDKKTTTKIGVAVIK